MEMTFTLPVCQLCNKEVSRSTSTTENIFTEDGMEETFFTITLSCGCVIQFPEFDVNLKDGTQTLKDGFTGKPVITYYDADFDNGEDED